LAGAPSLLTTKLYIPPPRPNLVPRPRLIERLDAGLHRKLTLISAPAGFGKTTLLSEWVSGCGRPVAWVSLDEGDDDPARFLAYFVAALQTLALSQVEGVFVKAPPSSIIGVQQIQ
jgi:LuxR family maltose regulon positive regulatory protein